MPMRFGEMVLIVRTQDFASRNLDRISASLGQLSKQEQLARRSRQLQAQQIGTFRRLRTARMDDEVVRGLQRRLELEKQISARQTGAQRGAGGRFLPWKAQAIELDNLKKRLATLPSWYHRLAGDEVALGNAAKHTNSILREQSKRLQIIQSDIVKVSEAQKLIKWEQLHRRGQALSRAGRIMQLTGLIATGSFVAAGNAAADFSANATLAATQARDFGAGTEQVLQRSGQLQAFINEQMQEFPVSADEMANAAYEIFSSLNLAEDGIVDFERGLSLLEVANKAAVAGGVSLDDSIKGLIITLNNFDENLDDVMPTMDTLFDIVRFGNIRFSDLTLILSKVAPAAKSVGHDLEDVAGALAQATRNLPVGTVSAGFVQCGGR